MTPSDELFKLIKSLTPGEKRYFKIWASKHVIGKSNHYEKLFDAIDVLPDDKAYDEQAFKKSLRGKSYGKNLSEEKVKLRDSILRSMRVYHADKNEEARLLGMIYEIRFLYDKGLVKSCKNLIDKATKLAIETEQYNLLLVINDYLTSLFTHLKLDKDYTAQRIEREERPALQGINDARKANYLCLRIGELDTTGRWAESGEEIRSIMEQIRQMNAQPDLSARAEIFLLNTTQFCYLHDQQYKECLEITELWLGKYESHPHRYSYFSEQYRKILANYMYSAMMLERFDLLPSGIDKINAIAANDDREGSMNFELATQYELIYLLNTSDYRDADQVLTAVESGLEKYKRYIPDNVMTSFNFNIAVLHFLRTRYSDALSRFHHFFYLAGRNEGYLIANATARALEWMCHYYMANYDILDTSLRNLKRFYKERKLSSDFCDAMFSLYATMIREGSLNRASVDAAFTMMEGTAPTPEWQSLREILLRARPALALH